MFEWLDNVIPEKTRKSLCEEYDIVLVPGETFRDALKKVWSESDEQ